jgi:hypothetical protein
MLGEDFARERFDFAEGDGFEAACSFKAKAKPSNAREKIKHAQLRAQICCGGHAASPQKPEGSGKAFSVASLASAGRCFHGIALPASRQLETALGFAPVASDTTAMPPSWSINCLLFMHPIKHKSLCGASA